MPQDPQNSCHRNISSKTKTATSKSYLGTPWTLFLSIWKPVNKFLSPTVSSTQQSLRKHRIIASKLFKKGENRKHTEPVVYGTFADSQAHIANSLMSAQLYCLGRILQDSWLCPLGSWFYHLGLPSFFIRNDQYLHPSGFLNLLLAHSGSGIQSPLILYWVSPLNPRRHNSF